jgi:hypothetical protein
MAEVKLDAIKDDSLGVSLEAIEMPDSLIRDVDGETLGHGQAQKSVRIPSSIMPFVDYPSNPEGKTSRHWSICWRSVTEFPPSRAVLQQLLGQLGRKRPAARHYCSVVKE